MKNNRGMATKVAVDLFWAKNCYFGHIFQDIDFKFVLLHIYLKINRKTKLEVNLTQNDNFSLQMPHKWPYLNSGFF